MRQSLKIGDRVKVLAFPDPDIAGKIGNVVDVDELQTAPNRVRLPYQVRLDDLPSIPYWFEAGELELIPEPDACPCGSDPCLENDHLFWPRESTALQRPSTAPNADRIADLERRVEELETWKRAMIGALWPDRTGGDR